MVHPTTAIHGTQAAKKNSHPAGAETHGFEWSKRNFSVGPFHWLRHCSWPNLETWNSGSSSLVFGAGFIPGSIKLWDQPSAGLTQSQSTIIYPLYLISPSWSAKNPWYPYPHSPFYSKSFCYFSNHVSSVLIVKTTLKQMLKSRCLIPLDPPSHWNPQFLRLNNSLK